MGYWKFFIGENGDRWASSVKDQKCGNVDFTSPYTYHEEVSEKLKSVSQSEWPNESNLSEMRNKLQNT